MCLNDILYKILIKFFLGLSPWSSVNPLGQNSYTMGVQKHVKQGVRFNSWLKYSQRCWSHC